MEEQQRGRGVDPQLLARRVEPSRTAADLEVAYRGDRDTSTDELRLPPDRLTTLRNGHGRDLGLAKDSLQPQHQLHLGGQRLGIPAHGTAREELHQRLRQRKDLAQDGTID